MNKVAKVAAIITLIIIIGVSLNYFTSLILERKTTITLRTSSPSSTTSAMSKTTTSTSTLPVAATRTGVPEGFVKVWVNGSIVSWSYCGRIVASIGFKPNVTLITSSSGLDLDLMVLGLNVFKVDEPILIERIRYVNSTGEVLEIPVGLLINTTRLKNLVFTTPCKQLKRIDLTLIPLIEDLEVKPYTLTIPVETVEEYELVEYREEKDTRNLKYTQVYIFHENPIISIELEEIKLIGNKVNEKIKVSENINIANVTVTASTTKEEYRYRGKLLELTIPSNHTYHTIRLTLKLKPRTSDTIIQDEETWIIRRLEKITGWKTLNLRKEKERLYFKGKVSITYSYVENTVVKAIELRLLDNNDKLLWREKLTSLKGTITLKLNKTGEYKIILEPIGAPADTRKFKVKVLGLREFLASYKHPFLLIVNGTYIFNPPPYTVKTYTTYGSLKYEKHHYVELKPIVEVKPPVKLNITIVIRGDVDAWNKIRVKLVEGFSIEKEHEPLKVYVEKTSSMPKTTTYTLKPVNMIMDSNGMVWKIYQITLEIKSPPEVLVNDMHSYVLEVKCMREDSYTKLYITIPYKPIIELKFMDRERIGLGVTMYYNKTVSFKEIAETPLEKLLEKTRDLDSFVKLMENPYRETWIKLKITIPRMIGDSILVGEVWAIYNIRYPHGSWTIEARERELNVTLKIRAWYRDKTVLIEENIVGVKNTTKTELNTKLIDKNTARSILEGDEELIELLLEKHWGKVEKLIYKHILLSKLMGYKQPPKIKIEYLTLENNTTTKLESLKVNPVEPVEEFIPEVLKYQKGNPYYIVELLRYPKEVLTTITIKYKSVKVSLKVIRDTFLYNNVWSICKIIILPLLSKVKINNETYIAIYLDLTRTASLRNLETYYTIIHNLVKDKVEFNITKQALRHYNLFTIKNITLVKYHIDSIKLVNNTIYMNATKETINITQPSIILIKPLEKNMKLTVKTNKYTYEYETPTVLSEDYVYLYRYEKEIYYKMIYEWKNTTLQLVKKNAHRYKVLYYDIRTGKVFYSLPLHMLAPDIIVKFIHDKEDWTRIIYYAVILTYSIPRRLSQYFMEHYPTDKYIVEVYIPNTGKRYGMLWVIGEFLGFEIGGAKHLDLEDLKETIIYDLLLNNLIIDDKGNPLYPKEKVFN